MHIFWILAFLQLHLHPVPPNNPTNYCDFIVNFFHFEFILLLFGFRSAFSNRRRGQNFPKTSSSWRSVLVYAHTWMFYQQILERRNSHIGGTSWGETWRGREEPWFLKRKIQFLFFETTVKFEWKFNENFEDEELTPNFKKAEEPLERWMNMIRGRRSHNS